MKLTVFFSLILGLFLLAPLRAEQTSGGNPSTNGEKLPALPTKPKDLPLTEKVLKDRKNREYGADYTEALATLAKRLSNGEDPLPPDLRTKFERELSVGRALCNAQGEFVGYFSTKALNERVITSHAALKDSLTSIWNLMGEAKMAEALTVQNTLQQMEDEYGLFIYPPIAKTYTPLMTPEELDDALHEYAQWARALNEWHRKNAPGKTP
jgi:hypothetical protein